MRLRTLVAAVAMATVASGAVVALTASPALAASCGTTTYISEYQAGGVWYASESIVQNVTCYQLRAKIYGYIYGSHYNEYTKIGGIHGDVSFLPSVPTSTVSFFAGAKPNSWDQYFQEFLVSYSGQPQSYSQ